MEDRRLRKRGFRKEIGEAREIINKKGRRLIESLGEWGWMLVNESVRGDEKGRTQEREENQ